MGHIREREEILEILKSHGAILERTKKHKVWRFPNQSIWVLPSTPHSDYSWKNNLKNLRIKLDINGDRGKPGLRREKKPKAAVRRPKQPIVPTNIEMRDLASQLVDLGLVEKFNSGSSSQRIERQVSTLEVAGSTPASLTKFVWWNPWTWKFWRVTNEG